MALIIIHSANIPLDMSGGSNTTTSTTSEINSSTNSTPVPSTRGEANSTTIESSKVIATNSTSGPHHALDDDHKKNLGMNSSSTSNSLYVIPYTDTKVERDYIASIQSQYLLANTTSSNSTQTKKKSIISMSVYGSNHEKYVDGALENAKLKNTYFSGWTVRFYVLPSFPPETIQKFKDLGAEVEHPPAFLNNEAYGMFWRFLAADDPQVERFISRDSDARLSARDRFAVEEWIQSGAVSHSIGDHLYHKLRKATLNGGLWGSSEGFLKNETMTVAGLIQQYLDNGGCSKEYGCDNTFLKEVIWPIMKHNQIRHDSFYCKDRTFSGTNAVGFPTPRDATRQVVGMTFPSGITNQPETSQLKIIWNQPEAPECYRNSSKENDMWRI